VNPLNEVDEGCDNPRHHLTHSFASLLVAQNQLQLLLGHNVHAMSPEARVAYIKENVLAASHELHELLDEVPWKSWATYTRDALPNRPEYVEEWTDVLTFLLNLALALNLTDVEIGEAFLAKNRVNRDRVRSRYDGHWPGQPAESRDTITP
jgi:dimeric dUTPase (all-alpha-NTP-PPase superfamily)